MKIFIKNFLTEISLKLLVQLFSKLSIKIFFVKRAKAVQP